MPRGGYLLVFSNPTEGEDDAFNDWYDSIHVQTCSPSTVSSQLAVSRLTRSRRQTSMDSPRRLRRLTGTSPCTSSIGTGTR